MAYEAWRQVDEWKRDHNYTLEKLGKQNRGWDDGRNETVFQREKEEAHDYRYFPDPDLVPVRMDAAWLEHIKAEVGELPLAMKQRFMEEYDLSDYDAGVLTADRATAAYFDAAAKLADGPVKRVANLVTQQGLKIARERSCRMDEIGVSPQHLAELAQLLEKGTVNASAGTKIFELMLDDDRDPETIAKENNLVQQSDTGAIEAIVDAVLAANQDAVAEIPVSYTHLTLPTNREV